MPAGATIQVAGDAAAVIQLGDGSRVELERDSRAVLHGQLEAARQVVELQEGAGTFEVTEGGGRFTVKTSIGDVTVLGTEFTVRLLSFGSGSSPSQGLADGEPLDHTVMSVVVHSGTVSVDCDGKVSAVASGEEKVFGPGAEWQDPGSNKDSLLASTTEYYGLTHEQRKAFPAAYAAYRKSLQKFNYSARAKRLRDDRKAGRLDARAYFNSRASLRQERDETSAGVGTLGAILNREQKEDWRAFHQYRIVMSPLRHEGVELTKEQLAGVRRKCRAAADRLENMTVYQAQYAKWGVYSELRRYVREEVLAGRQ